MFVKESKAPHSKVIFYQAAGFLAIIALSWFVESTGLRKWVLGNDPYIADFQESALEMLLILGVWLIVTSCTRRLVNRMRDLEGCTRVCAWCRRISSEGDWVTLEEFLRRGFDSPTTHGICPSCMARQKAAVAQAGSAVGDSPAAQNVPIPRPQPDSDPAGPPRIAV